MLDGFYSIIYSVEFLISLILISKYIYFEKGLKKRKDFIVFFSGFLISSFIVFFFNRSGNLNILLAFIFFIIYLFITRKKRKIRGIFLVFPISGMLFSFIILPIAFLYLFSSSMEKIGSNWLMLFDVVFWICLGLFIWKGKKWRIKYDELAKNRFLAKWERNLLNAVGLFFLLFSMLIVSIDQMKIASLYAKCFVAFGIVIVIFLECSIIAMIIQGNNRQYFENVALLNEYYLKAQLKHFQIYQKMQKETRRVHHDMKNHITCLYSLIAEQKYEESKEYIQKLNEQVEHIDQELHSGNPIIDAILNEKNATAKQECIHITVDGRLGKVKMDAIDLCTIFSNALDNAMEALNSSNLEKKEIQVDLKTKNSIQFFKFQNPVEKSKRQDSFFTTKKDYKNHGFGLGNIRMTVEKYHGKMEYQVISKDGEDYFILEIMAFD